MVPRYYRDEDTVVRLITNAVDRISRYKNHTLFVKAERALTKGGKMEPTENQSRMLRYIHTHGFISFEETLGMDWRYLGGLFTRGLVEWTFNDKGVEGLKPAVVGMRRRRRSG